MNGQNLLLGWGWDPKRLLKNKKRKKKKKGNLTKFELVLGVF